MSRSYRKPKAFICTGRNTEYYRDRNRNTRNKNKQLLRKALIDGKEDEVLFIPNNKNKNYDSWCEPTDGSFMAKESNFKNTDIWDENYFKKLCRK